MKKYFALLLTAALVITSSACVQDDELVYNNSAEETIEEDHYNDRTFTHYTEEMLKDYFIYDRVLYTNCYACSIEWVINNDVGGYNFDFSKVGELAATIEGMADLQEFKNNTANVLPVGTEIYEFPDRWNLLIAKSGNDYIPYMKMVEG